MLKNCCLFFAMLCIVTSLFAQETQGVSEERLSGILLPVASLPAKDIGNLGNVAREFLLQLQKSGQKIWQVLPVGPTIVNDSPFYSPSAFAISPNYIDLEDLIDNPDRKLLTKEEIEEYYKKFEGENPNKINYGLVWDYKIPLLRKAYQIFQEKKLHESPKFQEFLKNQSYWLEDYAFYMGIKEIYLNNPKRETWFQWEEEFKSKDTFYKNLAEKGSDAVYQKISESAGFHRFLQWVVCDQWNMLKAMAKELGIKIVGDCPIYVAPDSADVWANNSVFKLDNEGNQLSYAGVPPDYFSPKYGQFWGNPLYRWYLDAEEKVLNPDALAWWTNRLKHQFSLVDKLRIDHFRGFAGYWEVPHGKHLTQDENGADVKTSQYGAWKKGPGLPLFQYAASKLGMKLNEMPVIAEDLGVITKDVNDIREGLNAPGMGIFQFGPWQGLSYRMKTGEFVPFDSLSGEERKLQRKIDWESLFYDKGTLALLSHEFLPQNAIVSGKRVFYPGTHDNETLVGWYENEKRTTEEREVFPKYIDFHLGFTHSDEKIHWKVIYLLWNSLEVSYAIAQMQDILGLPNVDKETGIKIRTNIPNEKGQWQWKLGGKQLFTPELQEKLLQITIQSGRCKKT